MMLTNLLAKRSVIFVFCCLLALYGAWYFISPLYKSPQTQLQSATIIKPNKNISNFNLQDYDGKTFNDQSLRGHWTLLFFGYVGCPDICPATLADVKQIWQMYNPKPVPLRFVFASIDPLPVDNTTLKSFLQNYDPSFIGISGAPTAMQKLSSQLGVYANVHDQIIDHTATLMLINPQGNLYAVFTPPFDTQKIFSDLQILL